MAISMMRQRGLLARAALCLAAVIGTGSAQAVIYTGHWDPVYGTAPFQNLGWSVSAVFDMPDECLAQGDGSYTITGACQDFGFLSASLSFYDALDPTQTVLETFAIQNVANVNVTGVSVDSGMVSGIATGFFQQVVPTASGGASAIDGGGAYSFSLILLGDVQAQLYYASPIDASPACADNPVPRTQCGKSLNTAIAEFRPASVVPEPQTSSMLLLGLGALALASRRAARSASPRR